VLEFGSDCFYNIGGREALAMRFVIFTHVVDCDAYFLMCKSVYLMYILERVVLIGLKV
jgi:hypothetical protein